VKPGGESLGGLGLLQLVVSSGCNFQLSPIVQFNPSAVLL
jgi:hypothetical protein